MSYLNFFPDCLILGEGGSAGRSDVAEALDEGRTTEVRGNIQPLNNSETILFTFRAGEFKATLHSFSILR